MARISVPVDDVLWRRMQKLFPWGTQAAVMRRVCELLCDQIEREGISVIEMLITGNYNPLTEMDQKKRVAINGRMR